MKIEDYRRFNYIQSFLGKELTSSPAPFGRWLRGEITALSHEEITVSYRVRNEMLNPFGILHGGVMASMFDDTIGIHFFCLGLEKFYPPLNLHVDYLSSAREGSRVSVTSRVMKAGNTLINFRAESKNDAGKLLAVASSNVVASNIQNRY